ncbi:iron-sulfur cluster co-chaperone protein HscB isoform X2 [Scophthalmus maximus]|uniref:Iron-sulfur cluster co-chaperone protein HscB n=2 Tax=Scophthalmus maximus TaxID=52904 RepID=A0A8D3AHU4_SCOMX|nr:iron-sulfur cluster co-chaperone protein HscB isoform X2 [Scophthalmus maximus]
MLSSTSRQIVLSSRAALLTRSRLSVSKVAARPAHGVCSSLHTEDTSWHGRSMGSRGAPVRGRGPTLHAHQSNSPRNFCTGPVGHNCWKCEQPLDTAPAFFCVSCKVVQPPEEGVSYFKIMACDHTFTLDTHQLQKRYLQLQRSLHPDNFSQNSVREQEYSENQSALVNKAYTTLLKPLSRGLYMLELEGVRIEEGTDAGADAAFLMELMEVNEAVDEARTPEEADTIGRDTRGKLADLTERIDAALRTGELQTARALLAQMKYHANIEEKVKEKLREFM